MPTLQIMKSDEDVRMISAEAPVLFARVRLLESQRWKLAFLPASLCNMSY